MPYACWFLWWSHYIEDFKWHLHFQFGVSFWRVILREVYFEGPNHVWRALKTSILNTGCNYWVHECRTQQQIVARRHFYRFKNWIWYNTGSVTPKTLVHWQMPTGGANWMRSLWAGWRRRRGECGWIHKWMVHADNQVLAGHGQAQIMWRFFGRLALNGQRRHHILYQECWELLSRDEPAYWSAVSCQSTRGRAIHKRTHMIREQAVGSP